MYSLAGSEVPQSSLVQLSAAAAWSLALRLQVKQASVAAAYLVLCAHLPCLCTCNKFQAGVVTRFMLTQAEVGKRVASLQEELKRITAQADLDMSQQLQVMRDR